MAMTAEELGRLVGCSTATVSRALNNSGAVAPETRAAIYRTLRETRYTPQRTRAHKKVAATQLQIIYHRHSPWENVSLGRDGLEIGPLGPVSPANLRAGSPIGDSFWRGVIDGALEEIAGWGYKAELKTNIDLADPNFLAEVNAPDKAAVMVVGEYSDGLKQLVDLCRYPIVLADLICDDTHDVVTIDNLAGTSAAFDHLYQLGHRRIGFVGKSDNIAYRERYLAYTMKMAAAGLQTPPNWIYEGYSHIEETAAGMKKLLAQAHRPSAFLCANDCVAMGTIRAAAALGIRIPEQLSIVGFDDIEAAALVTPALSTVRVPVRDIGRQCIRLLMVQAKSGAPGQRVGCRVRLVPQLIIRESTAPAAAAAGEDEAMGSNTSGSN